MHPITFAIAVTIGVLAVVLASAVLGTLTDAQLTLEDGDALEIHVVSDSAAIDTQPAGLVFVAEVLVLE